jgi:hypothetical protein
LHPARAHRLCHPQCCLVSTTHLTLKMIKVGSWPRAVRRRSPRRLGQGLPDRPAVSNTGSAQPTRSVRVSGSPRALTLPRDHTRYPRFVHIRRTTGALTDLATSREPPGLPASKGDHTKALASECGQSRSSGGGVGGRDNGAGKWVATGKPHPRLHGYASADHRLRSVTVHRSYHFLICRLSCSGVVRCLPAAFSDLAGPLFCPVISHP